MEKAMKITAPEGFEIKDVKILDGVAVIMFSKKERKLPKSWEEFCEMYPVKDGEYYVEDNCNIIKRQAVGEARLDKDKNLLPDRATAEAVLTLCQLIQLRNAYNGDWAPDWKEDREFKFVIQLDSGKFTEYDWEGLASSPLFFKTMKLRDEFLRNFRPLIEKLKPLYGIKEGGEK